VHIVPSAQIDELLDDAKRKDQPVIIGGGDGSVRAAAQKLAGTQIPLGVIPLGTMNLFAREIEMPLDFDAALDALVTGEETRVDAASVNGDLFLCNSLMGLPAIFSRRRETLRGTGLVDGARKAWTLARRIAALRHRIGVELDDGTGVHAMRVMALAVSNNPYDGTSGVGLRRPKLDGGELGVYTSRHRTGLSAALALVRAYLGTWRDDPFVSEHRAHVMRVTSRRRRIWLSNDGEAQVYRTPLVYRCHPRALSVIVPRGHAGTRVDRTWSTIAIAGAGQAGSWLAAASGAL
jgi:diacylglycerol kinase family enzyme